MCDFAGRDQFGRMRIDSIVNTLDALGGSRSDLDRVLKFEKIWRDNNLRTIPDNGDQEKD